MKIGKDSIVKVKGILSLKIFLRIEQINIFQLAIKRVIHWVGGYQNTTKSPVISNIL